MTNFDGAYFAGLLTVFIIFLVLAILTFVWYILFLCIRCLCGQQCCCSCCQSIAACLCGGRAKEHYSQKWKFFVYGANILLGVLIFIFVVVGLAGNTQVSNGVSDVTKDVLNTINDVYNTANYSYNQLTHLNYHDSTVDNSVKDFRDTVKDIRDTSQDVRSQILKYDGYRRAAIGVGFGTPLFSVFLCVILLAVGVRGAHYLFTTFFTFSVMFLWISLGVHMPLKTLSSDACHEADYYIAHPDQIANISFLVSCLNNGSYLGTYGNITNIVNDGLQSIEDEVAQYGININTTIPPPPPGTSFEDQVLLMANFVNDQIQSVANALAQNPPANQSVVTDVYKYINDTTIYVGIALNVSNLATCDYFRNLLLGVKNHFCGELVTGAGQIVTGDWGTVVCFLLIAYFVLALYNIRFPASSPKHIEWSEPIPMQAQEQPSLVIVQTTTTQPGSGHAPYSQVPSGSPTEIGASSTEAIPILCQGCNNKFLAPPGSPSGSILACPNCGEHNEVPAF